MPNHPLQTGTRGRALRRAVLQRRRAINRCAAGCGVGGLILFGSVARGTATARSDIDIYVAFPGPRELGGSARLRTSLTGLLRKPVHIITIGCFEPWQLGRLKRDGIPLDDAAIAVLRKL